MLGSIRVTIPPPSSDRSSCDSHPHTADHVGEPLHHRTPEPVIDGRSVRTIEKPAFVQINH